MGLSYATQDNAPAHRHRRCATGGAYGCPGIEVVRGMSPHREGRSADQELRPYQKAGRHRETTRDTRRWWGCCGHYRCTPQQGPHKRRRCHGDPGVSLERRKRLVNARVWGDNREPKKGGNSAMEISRDERWRPCFLQAPQGWGVADSHLDDWNRIAVCYLPHARGEPPTQPTESMLARFVTKGSPGEPKKVGHAG